MGRKAERKVFRNPQSTIFETAIAKVCCSCKQSFPHNSYYTKGGRLDSRCKKCVSNAKAKTYARRKSQAKAAKTRRQKSGYLFSSTVNGTISALAIENTAAILSGGMREVFNGNDN